jgi:putative ABC transport system permease protein
MLRLALATLRTRWVSFAGAFLALALGTGVIAMMIMTLTAASSTPFPGPQRYAAAPAVVVPHKTIRLKLDGFPEDLAVRQPGALPAATVKRLAGTGATVPDRTFPARLHAGPAPGDESLPAADGQSGQVGHAWSAAAFTPYRLVAGRAPAAAGDIVVGGGDPALVNHQVQVTTEGGGGTYTVTGVTAPVWFEQAIFFTDAAAARLSPEVDAVVAYGPVDAVRRAAAGATQVLTGADRKLADPDPSGGKDDLNDAQAMAGTSTALGVSVAVFVVIATFAFITDQRRRELALLRTVGATPRQVRRTVIAEAAGLGLAASAVGCVLGVLASAPLNTWMIDHDVAPDWFSVDVAPAPLIIAFGIGLVSAILGAATAAWRAAKVRPTEALREAAVNQRVMTITRWILGVGLLGVGAYISATTISDSPGNALSVKNYLAAFLPVVGAFALLAPVILKPVARLVTWPLGHLGAGSMVVRENALTGGRRTAATVAPIVLVLGLAASILTVQATGDATHNSAMLRQTRADFTVVPAGSDSVNPQTVTAIRRVPGAAAAVWTDAQIRLATADNTYLSTLDAQAVDPVALTETQRLDVVTGSLSQLGDDFLIIDQGTARETGLHPGDNVRAYLPDGSGVGLRIAAVIRTGVKEETLYLSSVHAVGGLPSRIDVAALPGTTPAALGAALHAAVRGGGAQVVPMRTYLDAVRSRQQKETRQAISVILGVALVYSLITMASTLVMAAAGRKREIAALGLAGATRRQNLRFIAAESVLAVLIGAILAAGAAIVVTISQRAALIRLSADFQLSIPWGLIGVITAVCVAVAILASILSAARVLRSRLVELAGVRE